MAKCCSIKRKLSLKKQTQNWSEGLKINLNLDYGSLTSLQTRTVPKTTCKPSKKLSPITMTVAPPVVHPSLGQTALIVGDTEDRKPARKKWTKIEHLQTYVSTVQCALVASWIHIHERKQWIAIVPLISGFPRQQSRIELAFMRCCI